MAQAATAWITGHRATVPSVVLVASTSILCYVNSLSNGFVFDDFAYISSALIQQFDPAAAFVENWRHLNLYRPLALLSLTLDYQWHQTVAFGYHVTNLVLHTANSILFLRLASRLLTHPVAVAVAALLYSVHPVQSDVVNWISARGDLLMMLFFLTGLSCHLESAQDDGKTGSSRLSLYAAFLCYAGCALSKETGLVLPAVALWHDICLRPNHPEGNRSFTQSIWFALGWTRRHFGYVAVVVAILALRWHVVGQGPSSGRPASANFLADAAAAERLATIAAIFLRYLVLLVLPVRLSVDYSFDSIPLVLSVSDPWFVGGCLVIAGVVGVNLWLRSRSLGFATGFFFFTWLPTSNLLFLAPSGMAERYLYLPLVAVSLGVGLGVRSWLRAGVSLRQCVVGFSLIGLVLCLFAARTMVRNQDWSSDRALFSAVLAIYPDNARAHEFLGRSYSLEGEIDKAVSEYRAALVIESTNVRVHYNLGILYGQLQRYDEAILAYRSALRLNPRHLKSYYNLGIALRRAGRHTEARRVWVTLLRLDPHHPEAEKLEALIRHR